MEELKEPRGYDEDFDTDWYLSTYYECVEGNQWEHLQKFHLDFFHDTFISGKVGGNKLLDIGTGPTVHSVISASPHVNEIHLSDIVDTNRQVLQKWRDGADNVRTYFEYIIQRENKGESIESRNKMMREKVKKIYPLDLLQDKPFAEFDCKYDVITSCLCIDAAATNKEEYEVILSEVAEMLNPGGYLLLTGEIEEEFEVVGEFKFPCLYITEMEVQEYLKRAGFIIDIWKTVVKRDIRGETIIDYAFAAFARKA